MTKYSQETFLRIYQKKKTSKHIMLVRGNQFTPDNDQIITLKVLLTLQR